jgi:hypothetical protein
MLKMLLDLGASPNEQVKIKGRRDKSYETTASAWMIFCMYFAATMISKKAVKHKYRLCCSLEHFLATGVVDTNCVILIVQGRDSFNYEEDPTHRISLQQLVQQLEPANGESLLKMINGPRKGMLATMRYLTPSKSDCPSPESAYNPFDISMQPPSPPSDDGIDDKNDHYKHRFFLHSIKWGDTQLMAKNLNMRWY